jgi:Fe-S-cluster containining protein
MKQIDADNIHHLKGRRLDVEDTFRFRCHAGLSCFNRCCRNLNLFLYPYDVLRLKNRLSMSSDSFLDRHVDVVLREGSFFPDVLLRMADNPERPCPFLSDGGCRVYPDRPDTCRSFPVEHGMLFDAKGKSAGRRSFFRPPEFCQGQFEDAVQTLGSWCDDQEAGVYQEMTVRWAEVKQLFSRDPWGAEGASGPRAKMAFMATYNLDRFREFVFGSSFLKRHHVKPATVRRVRKDDTALMKLGFAWIRLFVWGMPSPAIRPKRRQGVS